jgi:hypothetical protein
MFSRKPIREVSDPSITLMVVNEPATHARGWRDLCNNGEAAFRGQSEATVELDTFKLKLVRSKTRKDSVGCLIKNRYAWRGYQVKDSMDDQPNRVTLAIYSDGQDIGTLTLNFDGSDGLLADALYKDEVDSLRAPDRRIIEIVRLAVTPQANSLRLLGLLFEAGYLLARKHRNCTDLLIEVNPRHVKFYQNALGFQVVGDEKICPRVEAPARLMRLDLEYAEDQIRRFRDTGIVDNPRKSIYRYFSGDMESDVLKRLAAAEHNH